MKENFISYPEALEKVQQLGAALRFGIETVELTESVGRVLGEDLVAKESLPPFSNSAMDGFALDSSFTKGASQSSKILLEVIGGVQAGDAPLDSLKSGCVEIMTGAPIPLNGVDAVVRLEDIEELGGLPRKIAVTAPVAPGSNIRVCGEDIRAGEKLLSRGTAIFTRYLSTLAALGHSRFSVVKKPRVVIISSGNEIVPFSIKQLAPGNIRNSTAPYLGQVLKESGAEVSYQGISDDTPEELERVMTLALSERPDILITTGGVSVGRYDLIPEVSRKLGLKESFHGVAIKPGKPLLLGQFADGPVFLGCPGNPVSSAVAFRFFLYPLLRRAYRVADERRVDLKLVESIETSMKLHTFLRARCSAQHGELLVAPEAKQGSAQLSSLSSANVWIEIPSGIGRVEKGELVQGVLLHPRVEGFI